MFSNVGLPYILILTDSFLAFNIASGHDTGLYNRHLRSPTSVTVRLRLCLSSLPHLAIQLRLASIQDLAVPHAKTRSVGLYGDVQGRSYNLCMVQVSSCFCNAATAFRHLLGQIGFCVRLGNARDTT